MNNKKTKKVTAIICALAIPFFSFHGNAQEMSWQQYEKEFIHPDLRAIPVGSVDNLYQNYYKQVNTPPEVTSSTIRVVLNDLNQLEFDDFHDGVAFVKTYHDGAFYIDRNGKVLFKTECKNVGHELPHFDNGAVLELHNRMVSVRDKTGKVIKSFKAEAASNFNNGIAMVIIPETIKTKVRGGSVDKTIYHTRIINTKGEFIYQHLWVTTDYNPYTGRLRNKTTSYRMKNLNVPMMPSTEGINAFAKFNEEKAQWEWGFFETATGKVLVQPTYAFVHPFKDGMAAVEVDEDRDVHRWGFVNNLGVEVIPPKYSKVPSDFSDGYARVLNTKNDAYIINKSGEIVKGPFSFITHDSDTSEKQVYISPFNNGYAIMGEFINLKPTENFEGERMLIYYAIDTNFNKLAWVGNMRLFHNNNEDIMFRLGQHPEDLFFENTLIDPKTLNILSTCAKKPYYNGLSRITIGGPHSGYLDRDNKYVIIFEKTEF